MIPVIDEYAAELGMFSDRILPLDDKWASSNHYCRRTGIRESRFHVDISRPGPDSRRETKTVLNCAAVADAAETAGFSPFAPRGDGIALSRIHHR